MANNVFLVGVLGAAGWLFVSDLAPAKPAERFPVSQVAAPDPSTHSYVSASHSPALEKRRDPVPLVRNIPASPVVPAHSETSAAADERQTQDNLDRRAARLAAELDGYKRVSIVGRASNGAWHAKGYRGTTEVLFTVDGTGRVSLD